MRRLEKKISWLVVVIAAIAGGAPLSAQDKPLSDAPAAVAWDQAPVFPSLPYSEGGPMSVDPGAGQKDVRYLDAAKGADKPCQRLKHIGGSFRTGGKGQIKSKVAFVGIEEDVQGKSPFIRV